jgi:hypothetical protein
MTVNAIANDLHKKVLLVDFGGLAGKKSDGSGGLLYTLRSILISKLQANEYK